MIIVLFFILFGLLALVDGNRGVKSFIVLILNFLIALGGAWLVSINVNSLIVTVISVILFCLTTIMFQNEVSEKSITALISTGAILLVMTIIIMILCRGAHITGLNEIDARVDATEYYSQSVNLNMLHILIMSLVWGELGAVVDTSISIATAMHEVKANTPGIDNAKLRKSGMNVGKDIIGTTVNTLAFVTLGESITLVLFYYINKYSFMYILNSKSFFQMVGAVMLSCIGCILIIPVTAALYPRVAEAKWAKAYIEKKSS